ncbi:hypothetical protein RB195_003674 [Necator americanus]|uniref:Transporter, major facilitator family protein n=1 Tax=Necator americanus TaxID=51031 RepID=A0ABR1DQE6_NECAM
MASSKFELFCAVLLGLGQMCIMIGIDTQTFVVEAVIHSVHRRNPTLVNMYAGYYGEAILWGSFMLSCIIAPALVSMITAKWALFLSSICCTLYLAAFQYLNNYILYTTFVILGFGLALYYVAGGIYLACHSTKRNIEKNTCISWSLMSSSAMLGSIALFVVAAYHQESKEPKEEGRRAPRQRVFSENEIRCMYGIFAVIAGVSNVIFACLPKKPVENCIEDENETSFRGGVRLMLEAFTDRRVIMLIPLSLYSGLLTLFWTSVYPTSLLFTRTLDTHIYLHGFYSLTVGSGEVLLGCFVAGMSKKIRNFGLTPSMCLGTVLSIAALTAALATVPKTATYEISSERALFVQPSLSTTIITAFLLGAADSCIQNSRTVVLCVAAKPGQRLHAFAISRLYQGLSASALMFLSPYMSIYVYFVLLGSFLLISLIGFLKAIKQPKQPSEESANSAPDVLPEKQNYDGDNFKNELDH